MSIPWELLKSKYDKIKQKYDSYVTPIVKNIGEGVGGAINVAGNVVEGASKFGTDIVTGASQKMATGIERGLLPKQEEIKRGITSPEEKTLPERMQLWIGNLAESVAQNPKEALKQTALGAGAELQKIGTGAVSVATKPLEYLPKIGEEFKQGRQDLKTLQKDFNEYIETEIKKPELKEAWATGELGGELLLWELSSRALVNTLQPLFKTKALKKEASEHLIEDMAMKADVNNLPETANKLRKLKGIAYQKPEEFLPKVAQITSQVDNTVFQDELAGSIKETLMRFSPEYMADTAFQKVFTETINKSTGTLKAIADAGTMVGLGQVEFEGEDKDRAKQAAIDASIGLAFGLGGKVLEKLSVPAKQTLETVLSKGKVSLENLERAISELKANQAGFIRLGYHIPRSEEALKAIEKQGFNLKTFGKESGAKDLGDPKGIYFFPNQSFKTIEGWKDLSKEVGVIKKELSIDKPFEFKTEEDLQNYINEIVNPALNQKFKSFNDFINYQYTNKTSNSSSLITKQLQKKGYDALIDDKGIYSKASIGVDEPQIIMLNIDKLNLSKEGGKKTKFPKITNEKDPLGIR